jgi:hypothetical protein
MEHDHPTTDRPVRIPPMIWILGFGLVLALAAIFIFNIPLGTVGYYALFAFFIGSHFFMHGGHRGHAGHEQRPRSTTNVDGPASAAQSRQDEHTSHSGGCH